MLGLEVTLYSPATVDEAVLIKDLAVDLRGDSGREAGAIALVPIRSKACGLVDDEDEESALKTPITQSIRQTIFPSSSITYTQVTRSYRQNDEHNRYPNQALERGAGLSLSSLPRQIMQPRIGQPYETLDIC